MTETDTLTSITAERGRECDARDLLRLLALTGISGSIGLRDIVNLGDGIHGRVSNSRTRKLVVKLNGLDLFDVEIGRIVRHTEWTIEAQVRNVHVEDLAETLIRLADEVWG